MLIATRISKSAIDNQKPSNLAEANVRFVIVSTIMKKGRNILVGMLLGALAGGIVTFFFQRAVYHARVQKLDSIYKEYVDRVIFAEETSSISDDVVTLHALRLEPVLNFCQIR